MGQRKGQTGNPGGRPKKESTIVFNEFFNAKRCKELFEYAIKLALDPINPNSSVLNKLLDKLVPNRQVIQMIAESKSLFDKLGINDPVE